MTEKNCLILDKEFLDYCKLNKISDVEKLARETFNKGFAILKYGETPFGGVTVPKIIEGKEKSNTKNVNTSRPVVEPAPQPSVKEPEDLKRMREHVLTTSLADDIKQVKKDIYGE